LITVILFSDFQWYWFGCDW